jgi:hypothetical protein
MLLKIITALFFYPGSVSYICIINQLKNIMTNKKEIKEIDKFLKQNDNQVHLGLVHHFYGPLRGCNFKIKVDNAKQLTDYIDSYEKDISEIAASEEKMNSLLESLKMGRQPKNLMELCTKVWIETGMLVQMRVLPLDIIAKAENKPNEVKTFKSGHDEILMQLAIAKAMKDPFFFRMGKI